MCLASKSYDIQIMQNKTECSGWLYGKVQDTQVLKYQTKEWTRFCKTPQIIIIVNNFGETQSTVYC